MDSVIQAYGNYIVIGLLFFCVVLLILCVVSHIRISKLKLRTNRFMKQGIDKSIEELLNEYINTAHAVENKLDYLTKTIDDIDLRLSSCISKTGIVRYNHFDDVGGDLCFALALLDENKNGTVINSIFSREGSYVYAKPIENGKSSYSLSDEEKQAITLTDKK